MRADPGHITYPPLRFASQVRILATESVYYSKPLEITAKCLIMPSIFCYSIPPGTVVDKWWKCGGILVDVPYFHQISTKYILYPPLCLLGLRN